MKKSLEAGTDLYTAIQDYRNTPTQGLETSPAQRLMNRRTKTLLPTTKRLLQPRVYYADKKQSQLKQRQERQRAIYDKNARDLPPLCEGDTVRMKPFRPGERIWRKAIVTEKLDDRSYYVASQDGGTYRRNRQHLNKSREQPPPTDSRQAHISTAEQAPTQVAMQTSRTISHQQQLKSKTTLTSNRSKQHPSFTEDKKTPQNGTQNVREDEELCTEMQDTIDESGNAQSDKSDESSKYSVEDFLQKVAEPAIGDVLKGPVPKYLQEWFVIHGDDEVAAAQDEKSCFI
ncbi:hypothetical protein QZH41_020210 [Actinostola sp. cb2023]|nr:hypothetical protein QZH41_020210 [Actinostola sp. cb2023]